MNESDGHNSIEIELKLKISDPHPIVQRLLSLGAAELGVVEQTDRLYESPHIDFRADNQALRLRTERSATGDRSVLTYKGSPQHTPDGHKVRDEFETEVSNSEQTDMLVKALQFRNSETIFKTRSSYLLDSVHIAIDEAKFGTFIELEGLPDEIERIRGLLELQGAEPVTEGYIFLQWAWEANHPEVVN